MEQKIQLYVLECKRCHHKWIPRTSEPTLCPHCKSYLWREEKLKKDQNN